MFLIKDEPLMTQDEVEHFLVVVKNTGVKNVKWSGLTKNLEENNSL